MDTVQLLVENALKRGRIAKFDSKPKSIPFVPVPDRGIDLSRGRSNGINGYQAEAERQRRIKERNAEMMAAALEEGARRAREIPKHIEADPIRPSIRVIQWHVCAHSNTLRNDLLSRRRNKEVVRPRQIGMMLSKLLTARSLPEIGREFGWRDHTTVLYAIRKTASLQQWLVDRRSPDDEIGLWVSAAFKGWKELGIK